MTPGQDGGALKRLGLIVNPIAGMGGRVGLKGSDGLDIITRAQALGAVAEAPGRTAEALGQLRDLAGGLEILTFNGEMGEDVANQAGFSVRVIGRAAGTPTTADDTRRAATAIVEAGADLLLFAGGDGTARDIYRAVGERAPVLGIPAGVKIHSAVYAINPRAAGQLADLFLRGQVPRLRLAEVMDIDEDAVRHGRVSAELYGYLTVPVDQRRVQSMKAGGGESDATALEGIAWRLVDEMLPGRLYVIGPGTSTQAVKERLGGGTLLGVDVARDRQVVARDVSERHLLEILGRDPAAAASIIVTVIGGQGHIFGRGNQQISREVIARVGRGNIRVMATREKLSTLQGRPLLVDTGDPSMDASLSGYLRVVVGYNDDVVMPVASSL